MQKTIYFAAPHGAYPFLTPFFLKQLSLTAARILLGDFINQRKLLQALHDQSIPFKTHLGMPSSTNLLLSSFASKPEQLKGCSDQASLNIRSDRGFQLLNASLYWELVNLISPDCIILPTEVPEFRTEGESASHKAIRRAIGKSTAFIKGASTYKGKIFYPILMYSDETIKESFNAADKSVFGYALFGLGSLEHWEHKISLLKSFLEGLSVELLLPGIGPLNELQHGFKLGIRHFQVQYPFNLAKESIAIISPTETKVPQKEKMSALKQSCINCLCCKSYSQAYVSHLVECKEMTAQVLLTLHNISYYL